MRISYATRAPTLKAYCKFSFSELRGVSQKLLFFKIRQIPDQRFPGAANSILILRIVEMPILCPALSLYCGSWLMG
jgi:hypothetical protein